MAKGSSKALLANRALALGVDVEVNSPGGRSYYTFMVGGASHCEIGLAAADSFLDGFALALRVNRLGMWAR